MKGDKYTISVNILGQRENKKKTKIYFSMPIKMCLYIFYTNHIVKNSNQHLGNAWFQC